MRPDHALAADDDAPLAERAAAEAACAFGLGRLDGLLAGLNPLETELFCVSLVREVLVAALREMRLGAAAAVFDRWYAGLEWVPAVPEVSASALVFAILGELSNDRWPPLAYAARVIGSAGRPMREPASGDLGDAIARAAAHIDAVGRAPLPFQPLACLHEALAADPSFAPVERAPQLLALGRRTVTIEPSAPTTPLWAVSLQLGRLVGVKTPLPGAILPRSLAPQLWPNERAVRIAQSVQASAQKLVELVGVARRRAAAAERHLSHLRANGRARALWVLLVAFGQLRLDQIGDAVSVTRGGAYAIAGALVEAGMARRERVKGRVVLVGHERQVAIVRDRYGLPPLPSRSLEEFDAALADLDRLLDGRRDGT